MECAFGDTKARGVATRPCPGTKEFNDKFNIVTGQVNFRIPFDEMRTMTGPYGETMARGLGLSRLGAAGAARPAQKPGVRCGTAGLRTNAGPRAAPANSRPTVTLAF